MFNEYILNLDTLKLVMKKMNVSFDRGLFQHQGEYMYSPLKMIPTYLHDVPNGDEEGHYFAIDLGGTNLRVLKLSLSNNNISSTVKHFMVPKDLMTGEGQNLFDYMARAIKDTLEEWKFNLQEPIGCMGITFSFPCKQYALNRATLIRWTKGFSATGVVDQDIVKLLKKSCNRLGLRITDYALINDTTGTLLSGAYERRHVVIGVINGTGTNACYIEDMDKVAKWSGPRNKKQILINTEWGAFGENSELDFITTDIDLILDQNSINIGQQIFEKRISGMYLGELVRLSIIKTLVTFDFFQQHIPNKLFMEDSFPTSLVSLSYSKNEFKKEFKEIFEYELSDMEYRIIFQACDALSRRSANLLAAGLAAIINRLTFSTCYVAADGSLFTKHPVYSRYVKSTLSLLTKKDTGIFLANDGSGKGAALAACISTTEHPEEKSEDG